MDVYKLLSMPYLTKANKQHIIEREWNKCKTRVTSIIYLAALHDAWQSLERNSNETKSTSK